MILCSPKNKYILFIDDTNIIITYKLLNNLTIINYNQHVMTFFYGINPGYKLNKLSINIDKTHCMYLKMIYYLIYV